MNVHEIITEMPKTIPPLQLDLDDAELNNKEYLKYRKSKMTLVKTYGPIEVYRIGDKYIGLRDDVNRVSYYMTFKTKYSNLVGNYVYQSLVWSDVGDADASPIAKDIFWSELVNQYDVVLTDSEQTWDGQRFWNKRIADAFANGSEVYFVDFGQRSMIRLNTPLQYRELTIKYGDKIWQYNTGGVMYRMAISK